MIYLDHHSTTPCDARAVEAMLPWMTEQFGNPHSDHAPGRQAAEAIEHSINRIATNLGAPTESLIVTSGATESNNLAITGVCLHPRQKRRHIVSVATEHPAVLDVLDQMRRNGFRITLVPVIPQPTQRDPLDRFGGVDLQRLADAIDDDTALVSVMWANNEIGTVFPIKEIAAICHEQGTLLHCDASQALGRLPIDIRDADVDLVSFSAHKAYGPKGIGLLVAGNGNRRVRLRPLILGGGQQRNLRSGTLNPAAIVAMDQAIEVVTETLPQERPRMQALRDQLWSLLCEGIDGLELNGVELDQEDRLAGNLNFSVPHIEGETWMAATEGVAFSTGSACSHASATPSHVLTALGLTESMARQSVRFGIGRGNDQDQIAEAAERLIGSYHQLRGGG